MSETAAELIFETHRGQAQFAYFQLGVAASAMAFAIHETADTSLADAPWPLGLAVILWAVSFALGCFGLEARQAGLASNAAFLQAVESVPPQLRRSKFADVIAETKEKVEENLSRPGARFRWQKWALFAGALAYIAGHVMHMSTIPPKRSAATRSLHAEVVPDFAVMRL